MWYWWFKWQIINLEKSKGQAQCFRKTWSQYVTTEGKYPVFGFGFHLGYQGSTLLVVTGRVMESWSWVLCLVLTSSSLSLVLYFVSGGPQTEQICWPYSSAMMIWLSMHWILLKHEPNKISPPLTYGLWVLCLALGKLANTWYIKTSPNYCNIK